MIAFDTNHLVRHIVQDDPVQSESVAQFIETESRADRPIRILDLVLMETVWVLQSVYGFEREALVRIIGELLEDSAFSFDDPNRLKTCLKQFQKGKTGFPDYLVLQSAKSQGLGLQTFDKQLRKEMDS